MDFPHLGVSDVAFHHDDKQRISYEKVIFLREIAERDNIEFLSRSAQELVKFVAEKMNESTPYISYLSIFTIASIDLFGEKKFNMMSFFEDYCNLWSEFQKWYFDRHGRMFSKKRKIENPLDTLFDRNIYQGQISPKDVTCKIEECLNKPICEKNNDPFGLELRYAIIIVKHVPTKTSERDKLKSLFPGPLHPVKWDIKHWSDIGKYESFFSYLEIVPFMISE